MRDWGALRGAAGCGGLAMAATHWAVVQPASLHHACLCPPVSCHPRPPARRVCGVPEGPGAAQAGGADGRPQCGPRRHRHPQPQGQPEERGWVAVVPGWGAAAGRSSCISCACPPLPTPQSCAPGLHATPSTAAGFTPEERASFAANLIEGVGLVDCFRAQHPDAVAYTYFSYRFNARASNRGWRLDHFLVSKELHPKVHDVSRWGRLLPCANTALLVCLPLPSYPMFHLVGHRPHTCNPAALFVPHAVLGHDGRAGQRPLPPGPGCQAVSGRRASQPV